uniref:Uncharacterized protein n=1 Tax=Arundo donax TaxID=35708 RepID=A0A0A9E429_ARUDO
MGAGRGGGEVACCRCRAPASAASRRSAKATLPLPRRRRLSLAREGRLRGWLRSLALKSPTKMLSQCLNPIQAKGQRSLHQKLRETKMMCYRMLPPPAHQQRPINR